MYLVLSFFFFFFFQAEDGIRDKLVTGVQTCALPISEMTTNFDLVKEQIRVAAGEPISFVMNGHRLRGHAIECRVNAEDPARNFQPSPGVVTAYHPPGGPGVRVDTHIYEIGRASCRERV